MPRQGQIIPQYLQPHVQTYINDNSVFEEVTSPVEDGITNIAVFISGKGRDGVLLPFEHTTDYIEEYGNPNYKLFGQPGYMPVAALDTGLAKTWCLRVMPPDACYSNVAIVAKVKVDKTIPATPKLIVRHEAVFLTGFKAQSDFSTLVKVMETKDPDVDGFVKVPLFGAYMLGRGVYGNTYRMRLSGAPEADADNGFKNYRFEVLDSEGGINRKELFTGSFYPDALSNKKTIAFEDIINDKIDGSQKLGFYVNEDGFQRIYDLYKAQVDPATKVTIETFDIFTGKDIAGTTIANITIDTTTAGTVALDKVEGIALAGGTDGAFAYPTATPEVRENAIKTAYLEAFQGKTDKGILSKRRTPAHVIYDANYPEEVKRALIALLLKRYDAYGYIDAGILSTATDATDWATTMATLGDRVFSKDCQHYMIKDRFSGKMIPVTVTYFFAGQIPVHFKQVGNQVPFQGESYAKLVGHVKATLKPVIDADDLDTKELLYKQRVNYFECIAENVFIRGTQGTSQNIWSDLSEESNVHVLLEMKRKIETIVATKMYNFAEQADRKRFTEMADRLFADYRGNKVRDVTVYFDMSKFEEERSILHCYLAITYKTIAKRGIIEIDINKRV